MEDEVAYLSVAEASRLFSSRELSPVELLRAQLERADEIDSKIGALVARYDDDALIAAKEAERRYARGAEHVRALEGITVAIKDETAIAGRTTTNGSLLYAEHIDVEDAPVVERIKAAGGVIHARTAAPEFCCAPVAHSRLWGVTRNPWNSRYSPGGSSAGAASGLAAGMTTLADGSDIGGSIRVPASFCGVVGFKPPYGRVPGTMPFALDHYCHQGPLGRTVADCAALENVMAGWHPSDIATTREEVQVSPAPGDLRGWRIALSVDLGNYRVDPAVRRNTQAVGDSLREVGAVVDEVELDIDPVAVRNALLGHFGAIFAESFVSATKNRMEDLTDYGAHFIESGAEQSPDAYREALDLETSLYRSVGELFSTYQALVCPTNATAGMKAGESYIDEGPPIGGEPVPHLFDSVMTIPFNLVSRCPVISVPSGLSDIGVPTGVQIVAPPFDDGTTFQVGAAIESQVEWMCRPTIEGLTHD